jgi:hypothetical protein
MSSCNATLQLLLTQVQFELVEAAAKVAKSSQATAASEDEAVLAQVRSQNAASQLRAAMMRSRINPALLTRMRHIYLREHRQLHDSQARNKAAKQCEEQAWEALSELRNRERSLERVLQERARQDGLRQQAIESVQADELWLSRGVGGMA